VEQKREKGGEGKGREGKRKGEGAPVATIFHLHPWLHKDNNNNARLN